MYMPACSGSYQDFIIKTRPTVHTKCRTQGTSKLWTQVAVFWEEKVCMFGSDKTSSCFLPWKTGNPFPSLQP